VKPGKIVKKLAKVFKSGSKDSKKGGSAFSWPSGTRIAVYGHANAGKTVYFTVLNEECKIGKDLQLSITDTATASDILSNYRAIWGVGTETGSGTVVDLRGEKKFPDPTPDGKLFLFNAILDRSRKYSVCTYDYGGKAISLNSSGELAEKVADFTLGSDGILFFFDPKVLGAEMQTHAHVASFVSLLEKLAPLDKKLPIPIALVITKADILPGFSGEDQSILVSPEDENILSEDFDLFLEKILGSDKIASNSDWSESVRTILVKLREFLKVVVGRTLNFQIFFVSSTGQQPEKIGTDIGRSLYAPPPKITPIGIKKPFYWILNSIVQNKRVAGFKKLAKYVAVLSILSVLLFSAPYLYHDKFLLDRAVKTETDVLKAYSGNIYNTTLKERNNIINAYRKYDKAWITRNLFPRFRNPVARIRSRYENFNLGEALKRLDESFRTFNVIVKDKKLWPKLNPSDTTLIETENHKKLVASLENFHQGDESTSLYKRSGRALTYWNLFTQAILAPNDTTIWETIRQQVEQDRNLYANDMSKAEKELGKSLMAQKVERVQKVVAKQAGVEFDDVIENVNNNMDPDYRFGKAVRDLRKVRGKLDPSNTKALASIDKYIREVKKWEKRQSFTCKIVSIPDQGHLHIEVTRKGEDPSWSEFSQIFEGDEFSFKWKLGDEIHIAFDMPDIAETWGKDASDKKTLRGNVAIFDMDGEIQFSNIGKTINISFTPGLIDRMPTLE